MKPIQAIVLDLDGTLLNSHKQVSPRNQAAVMALHARGIAVIIATARPLRSVKCLLPAEWLALGYQICYNGAFTVNEAVDVYEHLAIPRATAAEIYRFIKEQNGSIPVTIEVEDTAYADCILTDEHRRIFGIPEDVPPLEVISGTEMETVSPSKILLANVDGIYSKLKAVFRSKVNIICTDGQELIQIMNKQVSKENALRKVLDRSGIKAENTIVFGDDHNDLGLFDLCGIPVAMGNAVEELKAKAALVTDTNDRDGVARILEQWIEYGEGEERNE